MRLSANYTCCSQLSRLGGWRLAQNRHHHRHRKLDFLETLNFRLYSLDFTPVNCVRQVPITRAPACVLKKTIGQNLSSLTIIDIISVVTILRLRNTEEFYAVTMVRTSNRKIVQWTVNSGSLYLLGWIWSHELNAGEFPAVIANQSAWLSMSKRTIAEI